MQRRSSISRRLLLVFLPAIALVLVGLIGIVYAQSAALVRDLLADAVLETAGRHAATIQSRLGEAFISARFVAQLVDEIIEEPQARRRAALDVRLRRLLERNANFAGVWTTWEPDALDGLDARNRDSAFGNDAGRVDITWFRGADGSLKRRTTPESEILTADYYLEPKRTMQETLIGPYFYEYGEEGVPPLFESSIVVPLLSQDARFKGVIGIDVPQSFLQAAVASIKPYGDGFAALYAKGGLIAGHREAELLGKKIDAEAGRFVQGDFERYAKAVENPEDVRLRVVRDGVPSIVATRKFRLGSSYTRWTLVIVVPETKVLARSGGLALTMGLWGLVALLALFVVTLFASRAIARPIRRVSLALKSVAEGEGELSARLPAGARDETGELARYFNEFVGKLESTVARLKDAARGVAAVGEELAASAEESSATVTELEATVRSLQGKIAALDGSIVEVEEAVDGIARGIGTLEDLVRRQTEGVRGAKAVSEGIVRELGELARSAGGRGAATEALAMRAREGEAKVGGVLRAVKEIGGYAERIAGMAGVINDVAERTNLLAMNAAIEAAHAGDRGRGFAVVADEIRKLAEATGGNAATIGRELKAVIAKIDDTAAGAEEAGGAIRAMSEGMGEAASSFREVVGALESLAVRGSSVGSSLDSLVGATDELERASADMGRRSAVIRESTAAMARLSRESRAGFDEMAVGIREMTGAAEALSHLGLENARNTGILKEELGRFKADEADLRAADAK